jgi:mannose/fructose/sorbose-specific phosphotransferase system IIB component
LQCRKFAELYWKPWKEGRDSLSIELVRIDDRLIHGQIIMAWSKAVTVERIVVIDDKAAMDVIRKTLFQTVAPPGIKVAVLDVGQGIECLKNNLFGNEKLFLLVTTPATLVNMVESGVKLTNVNIGGMSFSQGKVSLTKAVSLDAADKKDFEKLHKYGIVLQIQVLPNDVPIDIMTQI